MGYINAALQMPKKIINNGDTDMRRLINCPTCSPSDKTTRNIWDVNSDRTRTCRCCGMTVTMKALPADVVADRAAHNANMEALMNSLLADA